MLQFLQLPFPVKLEIGAALGLSPLEFINKATLENEILGLQDLLAPLQSSHTMKSESGQTGRPEKNEDEISDSGQVNKDRGSDVKRTEG